MFVSSQFNERIVKSMRGSLVAVLIFLVSFSSILGTLSANSKPRGYDQFLKYLQSSLGTTTAKAQTVETTAPPVNNTGTYSLFVKCVEKNENGKFSAVFGYENKTGQRLELSRSSLTPDRGVIHSHHDSQKLKDPNLDLKDPDILKKLSGPIDYMNPARDDKAMIVQGEGNETVVWTVSAEIDGKKSTRTASANLEYKEKCEAGPLVNSTPPNYDPEPKFEQGENLNKQLDKIRPEEKRRQRQPKIWVNPQNPADKEARENRSQSSSSTSSSASTSSSSSSSVSSSSVSSSSTSSAPVIVEPEVEPQPNLEVTPVATDVVNAQYVKPNGFLDLNDFCFNRYLEYGAPNDTPYAYTSNNSPKCSTGGIDVNRACSDHYGAGSYAVFTNPLDQYSWQCFKGNLPPVSQGPLYFGFYCLSISDESSATPPGGIFGWKCDNIPINVQAICDYEFNGTKARNSTPSNINTWECIVPSTGENPGGGTNPKPTPIPTPTPNPNPTPTPSPAPEPVFIPDPNEPLPTSVYEYTGGFIEQANYPITVGIESIDIGHYVGQVAGPVVGDVNNLVFGPLSRDCGYFDLDCKGKYLEALANSARLVAAFLLGVLKGVGQYIISLGEIFKMVFDLGNQIQGMISMIKHILDNPSIMVNMLINFIDEFNSKNIFDKFEFLGTLIGQTLGDVVMGILAGTLAVNLAAKFTQVLDKVKDVSTAAAKVINVAEKFVGKTLKIADDILLPIKMIDNVISLPGNLMKQYLINYTDNAFQKLLTLVPEGSRNHLRQYREFTNRLCPSKSSASNISSYFGRFCPPGYTLTPTEVLEQLRKVFNTDVKPDIWKKVHAKAMADGNSRGWSDESLKKMKSGDAAIGPDGKPMNIHHVTPLYLGGSNDLSNLRIMTNAEHAGAGNFGKIHYRPPFDLQPNINEYI